MFRNVLFKILKYHLEIAHGVSLSLSPLTRKKSFSETWNYVFKHFFVLQLIQFNYIKNSW